LSARVLRGLAIAIAVLASIDPVLTRSRTDRPTIAVVAADESADSLRTARVRSALNGRFDVVSGPFGGADASVVVGDALRSDITRLARPVFVVRPSGPRITIERLDAPASSPIESSVRVGAMVHVRNALGSTLNLSLSADSATVAATTVRVASDDERVEVPFLYAPTSALATNLRVSASLPGTVAHADRTFHVTTKPWSVLFHDPRPSWTSTFVRRAIERDPRFAVASRIGATRGAVSAAGRPAQLADASSVDDVDLIVVGAPDALGAADASALDRYMRRRGGSVVFLLDQRIGANSPAALLIGAGAWRTRDGGAALALRAGLRDTVALRAIELAWPESLPIGSEPVAQARLSSDIRALTSVIWRTSIGAGQLTVSGALDAWRYRDASESNFDGFWRELVASEAARSVKPIDVRVTPPSPRPGERVTLQVALRTPTLAAASLGGSNAERATVSARIEGYDAPIRLWPGENVGTFVGDFHAPASGGAVVVVSGRDTAKAHFAGAGDARSTTRDATDALAAFASATGGATISEAELDQLSDALRTKLNPASRSEPWHPMRSAWWILPFAVLLSAEWWMRRRSGLA
jgi:hypothetical protein